MVWPGTLTTTDTRGDTIMARYLYAQHVQPGDAIDGDTVTEVGYAEGVFHFYGDGGDELIAVVPADDVVTLSN